MLLAAGAAACAQPVGVGKSALHAAAEAGHEAVARLLVHADPQAIHARSEALAGHTPLQVAYTLYNGQAQLYIAIHYTLNNAQLHTIQWPIPSYTTAVHYTPSTTPPAAGCARRRPRRPGEAA